MLQKQINNNKRGFIALEVVIGLVVIAAIAGAVWFLMNQKVEESVNDKDSQTSSEENGRASVTVYPTPEALPTDSKDADINAMIEDSNELNTEVNGLDQQDSEMDLPSVDFSE
jgi:hypothetical protein